MNQLPFLPLNRTNTYLQNSLTRDLWAVVDPTTGRGDYTDIPTAVASGAKYILVRSGTYKLTAALTLNNQCLVGENRSTVIIQSTSIISFNTGGTLLAGGTIALNNGSATVNGVGTAFDTFAGSSPWIKIGNTCLEVLSVDDATTLTLKNTYRGHNQAAGTSYVLFDADSESMFISGITFECIPSAANTEFLRLNGVFPTINNCFFTTRPSGGNLDSFISLAYPANNFVFKAHVLNCFFSQGHSTADVAILLRYSSEAIIAFNTFSSLSGGAVLHLDANSSQTSLVYNTFSGPTDAYIGLVPNSSLSTLISYNYSYLLNEFSLLISPINTTFFSNILIACGDNMFELDNPNRCSLNNNIILDAYREGIWIDDSSGIGSNNSINNNIIPNPGRNGILLAAHENIVNQNIIVSAASDGIEVEQHRNIISNNSLHDCSALGIKITNGADNNLLNANQIQNNINEGIRFENGCDKNIATSNVALNNLAPQINDTLGGANNVLADNIVA